MANRQCPHCGGLVDDSLGTCPHCKEDIFSPVPQRVRNPMAGRLQIRRGLMYMWLSGIFYYFTAGYSNLEIPFQVSSVLNDYLLPFMFAAGLGLLAYGIFLKFRG